jgi:hypothetical protein
VSTRWRRLGAGFLAVVLISLGGCAGVPATSVKPPPVTDPGCIDEFSGYARADCR